VSTINTPGRTLRKNTLDSGRYTGREATGPRPNPYVTRIRPNFDMRVATSKVARERPMTEMTDHRV